MTGCPQVTFCVYLADLSHARYDIKLDVLSGKGHVGANIMAMLMVHCADEDTEY